MGLKSIHVSKGATDVIYYGITTWKKTSNFKRRNTVGRLDQYMAQHGRIVKQSYCETVQMMIFFFNSN